MKQQGKLNAQLRTQVRLLRSLFEEIELTEVDGSRTAPADVVVKQECKSMRARYVPIIIALRPRYMSDPREALCEVYNHSHHKGEGVISRHKV